MTAVLTGSSGMLGNAVAKALARRNIIVQPLRARFAPAAPEFVPIETAPIAAALRAASPRYVFHLAGTSSASSVAEFYRVNTLFAAVLLDALDAAGLDLTTLVLIGSAAEYGPMEESSLPAREDCRAQPVDFYGASKLAQTFLGVAAARRGRRVVIARPSNIIGPGMARHLALGSFAHQLGEIARGKRPATLEVGDLSGRRDLIDVCDAAEVIVRLAECPAANGQVVNVCTGRSIAIGQVLDLLLRVFDCRGHGQVRVEQRIINSTSASSTVHFSCNQRLAHLVGPVEYTPLEETLGQLLDAELDRPIQIGQ